MMCSIAARQPADKKSAYYMTVNRQLQQASQYAALQFTCVTLWWTGAERGEAGFQRFEVTGVPEARAAHSLEDGRGLWSRMLR